MNKQPLSDSMSPKDYVMGRLTEAAELAKEIVLQLHYAPEVFVDEPGQREISIYGMPVLVTHNAFPNHHFSAMFMRHDGRLVDGNFTDLLNYVLRRFW